MNHALDIQAEVDETAQIDPTAHLCEGVCIGANVIVGPGCVIGPRCRLMHHSVIVEHTTMGQDNVVHPFAVLGSDPQDVSFRDDERGELIIGDRNVLREFVTIGRGNWNGPPTRIGSDCYLMNQAHVGHNAQVGDRVVMSNAASLAGHSSVASGCVMSGFAAVHQYVNIGEGVMFQAHSAVSMHVPPFVVLANSNTVVGLNIVGLKRNPRVSSQDRDEIKQVYRAIYRKRSTTPVESVCRELMSGSWGWAAREFLEFVLGSMQQEPPRRCGIVGGRARAGRGMRTS